MHKRKVVWKERSGSATTTRYYIRNKWPDCVCVTNQITSIISVKIFFGNCHHQIFSENISQIIFVSFHFPFILKQGQFSILKFFLSDDDHIVRNPRKILIVFRFHTQSVSFFVKRKQIFWIVFNRLIDDRLKKPFLIEWPMMIMVIVINPMRNPFKTTNHHHYYYSVQQWCCVNPKWWWWWWSEGIFYFISIQFDDDENQSIKF